MTKTKNIVDSFFIILVAVSAMLLVVKLVILHNYL